jgi:hypothetical protein
MEFKEYCSGEECIYYPKRKNQASPKCIHGRNNKGEKCPIYSYWHDGDMPIYRERHNECEKETKTETLFGKVSH